MSGSSPARMRRASSSQAGTVIAPPYGEIQVTSWTDEPWRASKKHGDRRSGAGAPLMSAFAVSMS